MVLFYVVAFALLFVGMKVSKRGEFFDDYMGREQSNVIKGLFILLVFISHSMLDVKGSGYIFDGIVDFMGLRVRNELLQLIVAPFLYYSGYGVMESIMNKGHDYIKSFPRRRILTVLLNFDIAVCCFILLDLALGIHLSLKQVVLSLFAWGSVGNSNWYIFVILCCYMVSWIAFLLFKNKPMLSLLVAGFMALAGMVILSYIKCGQNWWYDTMLCYPAGMAFSYWKKSIDGFFRRYYWAILGVGVAFFLFIHLASLPDLRGLTYNIKSIFFVLVIVLLTMRVKTGNKILYWFGISLFPIYIYQRIPMIAIGRLAGSEWVCSNPYLFMVTSLAITCVIAFGYKYWQVKLK